MADLVARIQTFLDTVDDSSRSEHDSIGALMASLDELVASVHGVSFVFDNTEYDEPPSANHTDTYRRVAARYPSFGYYNIPLDVSEKISDTTLAVGDAISDVAEIYDDMQAILWRFKYTSKADALFHFQLGYRSHWGRHLRELQLYAHDLHW
jgi:hypothetical protein